VTCRKLHTELNRLITTRLAFAIPIYAQDPSLYAHGIKSFAQVYFAFEDAWQDLISQTLSDQNSTNGQPQQRSQQIHRYLSTLVPPGLWRTQRLESDISYLETTFGVSKDAGQNKQSRAFSSHIYEAIKQRPHVLLAYSWVMYMATFSGGRWIRQQLGDAGADFWRIPPTLQSQLRKEKTTPGVSFLCFDGDRDGEDIKIDFKTRLAKADEMLTPEEKEEVIAEAKTIFTNCIGLVEALDEELGTAARVENVKQGSQGGLLDMKQKKPLYERIKENREAMPYAYPTQGVHPLGATICIMLGIGLWFYLFSNDWLPSTTKGLLSG